MIQQRLDRMRRAGGSLRKLRATVHNALELSRFDQTMAATGAPFTIVDRDRNHTLRRYDGATAEMPVALLVPPLMVAADIYDIAPADSAVRSLLEHGISPWVVDFGAPEEASGGLERTLDDHLRAVIDSIHRVRASTGKKLHLLGYSQGGLFAYQAAAYLHCEGLASVVTFGSPVDSYKGIKGARSEVVGTLQRALEPVTSRLVARVESIPKEVVALGFKLASPKKTFRQRVEFVRSLHDRERTMRREPRRRFLAGRGFVAWPGPAFREASDYAVHNRMLTGGFVVDDKVVSLSDVTCPVLAFVGSNDEIALPDTVRAIANAAPNADVRLESIPAGHFGLVVGSQAMKTTWPTVSAWITAIDHGATAKDAFPERRHTPRKSSPHDARLLADVARHAARDALTTLGNLVTSANDAVETLRWQEARLRRLARIRRDTRVSSSRELARRAKRTPDAVFFVWQSRPFTYAEADERVSHVAGALHACGVDVGDRVGLLMHGRPSLLSAVTALHRLGAAAVVAPTEVHFDAVARAFEALGVERVIVDPEHLEVAMRLEAKLLVLGGSTRRHHALCPTDPSESMVDLEKMDPEVIRLPRRLAVDRGCADDVALVLLRPNADDGALAIRSITNHRWILSALGAAAACAIKPTDTVSCALPLDHPTGLVVGVGSALVSGARLALHGRDEVGVPIDRRRFLVAIRRVGATVVFYAGEMLRPLVHEAASSADRHLPVRMFAGSGMRPALANELRVRFGADTMELYSGLIHRAILADPTGDEPGSLGSVLPGSSEVALVKCDLVQKAHLLDDRGLLILADANEPGLFAVKVSVEEIDLLDDTHELVLNAFGDGSIWLVTNDVLRRDEHGRYWFVDTLNGFVTTERGEAVSTRGVEDALYSIASIRLAAAWEVDEGKLAAVYVSDAPVDREELDRAFEGLSHHARPATLERVERIPLTTGYRPDKRKLAERFEPGR